MKFLCGNCKAKYQIADEKIAGRTLRMKCRRCSHDIVIRGEELEAPAQPASRSTPSRRRAPAPAPAAQQPRPGARRPSGSALGADFRQKVTSGAHEPPPRVSALDQWHVAVNDVPVGPIKRDEIARKVAAGAVDGDSLVWREGFDDWRPLKEVPELAPVLQKRPAPPRPPPPAGGILGGRAPASRPRAQRTTSSATRSSSSVPSRPAEPSRPAARSNVVPIGGRLGAAAAPALAPEEFDDFEGEPTRVSDPLFVPEEDRSRESPRPQGAPGPEPAPAAAVFPAAPPVAADPFAPTAHASLPEYQHAPQRRRGLPVGAWIAIAGAGAFGMMLAAMVGTKLLSEDEPEVAVAPAPPPAEPSTAEPELVVPEEVEPTEEPQEAQAETEGSEARDRGTAVRRPAGGSTGPATKTKQLSAEERALLERFGGESSAAPGNIRVGESGDAQRRTGQVNAQQLNAVVSRNKPQLRRCYEIAIRGMSDPPTVRVNVTVTIGASGGVTNVVARTEGQTLGSLGSCIESTARRWRFPAPGETVATQFPVVFAPGS